MEKYYSDLCDRVTRFIDRSYTNYALMIDGAWGSGKTHFIKHNLIKCINENEKSKVDLNPTYNSKDLIYMSLYGMESIDDILKSLWIEKIPISKMTPKENKGIGYVSNISRAVIGGGLSFFNISLPEVDYNSILSLNNTVIIFDDIERSQIELNSLLGFINNFVEHDGIKVILVGNQKEMSHSNDMNILSANYSLALSDKIKFPEKSKDVQSLDEIFKSIVNSRSDEVDDRISISELKQRAECLFNYKSDYDRIKEKLIGVTIKYQPDMSLSIDNIITKFAENATARKILKNHQEETINILKNNNHLNYRTLIFAFEKFDELCEEIIRQSFKIESDVLSSFLSAAYFYTLELAIKHKIGGFIHPWSNNEEFGKVKTS